MERQLKQSERGSEEPEDEGATPSRSTIKWARVVPQVRYKFDSYHRRGSTPLYVGTKTCYMRLWQNWHMHWT